jgi:hypothetical protein
MEIVEMIDLHFSCKIEANLTVHHEPSHHTSNLHISFFSLPILMTIEDGKTNYGGGVGDENKCWRIFPEGRIFPLTLMRAILQSHRLLFQLPTVHDTSVHHSHTNETIEMEKYNVGSLENCNLQVTQFSFSLYNLVLISSVIKS